MNKNILKKIGIAMLIIPIFGINIGQVFAANEDENDGNTDVLKSSEIDLGNLNQWDQFEAPDGNIYTVTTTNSTIYIGSGENQQEYNDLYNFEITYETENGNATTGEISTWRKYIKLEDLCSEEEGVTAENKSLVCEIMSKDDESISLKRTYKTSLNYSYYDFDSKEKGKKETELYYKASHDINTKEFASILELVDLDNPDGEPIDTYIFEGSDQISNEAGKFSEEGILTTDINTLIDSNGDWYVSLRFVSEALGAEVTWESTGNDTDEVYIEFYDDEEYCKDIEYEFTEVCNSIPEGEEYEEQRQQCLEDSVTYVEDSLYGKNTLFKDLSLNGTYTYTDSNGEKLTSDIDWRKLYVLLTMPDEYDSEDQELNNTLDQKIYWDTENERLRISNYVDKAKGEKVDIYGLIMYKGVPIPINLFTVNDNNTCGNNN